MCGRYTIRSLPPIEQLFHVQFPPEMHFAPRFNVAPTQEVPVVWVSRKDERTERRGGLMRWGLIPSWAKDASIGNRMINARAESVTQKPAFRNAFARRRCLVPADGFYEWKKLDAKTKQPYFIHLADDRPFAFGGMWEYWRDEEAGPDDQGIRSFTILTTEANEMVAGLHDRMPVIIAPEDFERWLDPSVPPEKVKDLLRPYPAEEMDLYPISRKVNSPKNDDPDCIDRLTDE
jgi:putative SOS response-associated peptidase YedK